MNKKHKFHYTGIIVLIAIVLLLSAALSRHGDNLREEEEKYTTHLGKEIILNGDTLTLLDYSLFKGVYTMEDGRDVHQDLVLNLIK